MQIITIWIRFEILRQKGRKLFDVIIAFFILTQGYDVIKVQKSKMTRSKEVLHSLKTSSKALSICKRWRAEWTPHITGGAMLESEKLLTLSKSSELQKKSQKLKTNWNMEWNAMVVSVEIV